MSSSPLRVVGELGSGTVVSHRDGGAVVVTRPGSFGGPDSLLHVAERLLDGQAPHGSSDAVPGSLDTATPAASAHAPQHVTPKENP